MRMISTSELDKNIITEFFIQHWGSPQMVISSGVFQRDALPRDHRRMKASGFFKSLPPHNC
ncbi:hypothetical protein [Brevibacillus brevis]|uniref:hypothetical protein n=1 Tax=Brevibacillus brevis TaxID=1393 RepID=UPI0021BD4C8E|nr:hypothetical protein [Brevibacillus brevis]